MTADRIFEMSEQPQQDGREKRRAARYRVLSYAKVIASGVQAHCVVRDLSNTGAKLGIAANVNLPREFDILFAERRSSLKVELMWRRGDFAGVRFCSTDQALRVIGKSREKFILEA